MDPRESREPIVMDMLYAIVTDTIWNIARNFIHALKDSERRENTITSTVRTWYLVPVPVP